jgi:hypothetical protein
MSGVTGARPLHDALYETAPARRGGKAQAGVRRITGILRMPSVRRSYSV